MTKKNIIFHPWLFTLIPIINLFENNQDIASIYYLPKPITIALMGAISLFFIFNIFIKDKIKSALITSVLVVSFFSFNILNNLFFEINHIIPHKLISYEGLAILVYIIVIFAISFLITTSSSDFKKLNKILNFFTLIIITLQLFNILNYQYQNKVSTVEKTYLDPEQNIITESDKNINHPDIYYIILDGYGRQDILQDIYNYDNNHFINFLKEKGFYVAEDAHSNYNQTFLSMSSSLNMNYLDKIITIIDDETSDRSLLRKILKDNLVYDFLKEKKYTFVSLSSTWSGSYKNTKSDIKLPTNLKRNNFDLLLINKTPLSLFLSNIQIKSITSHLSSVLDKIPEIANIEDPTFSYIHIISPHPPFVFKADGSIVNIDTYCTEVKDGSHYFKSCPGVKEYRERYANQLAYLNIRFESIINKILDKSKTPPIIILQADHGPGSMLDWESAENSNIQERLSILSAYYVPEETKEILYPNISPVNSFRVLFNSLFNGQFEILEDKSYFAIWDKPYKFIDVSEELN